MLAVKMRFVIICHVRPATGLDAVNVMAMPNAVSRCITKQTKQLQRTYVALRGKNEARTMYLRWSDTIPLTVPDTNVSGLVKDSPEILESSHPYLSVYSLWSPLT